MKLADILSHFETDFLRQYGGSLLPSQRAAMTAFKSCRNALSAKMAVQCNDCQTTEYVPHSCGHRNCPNCQAHESQQWITRQQAKQLPCDYFMLTFTVPNEWRQLAWRHQTIVYDLVIKAAWETANTFSQHDKKLQGGAGAVTVLHTHTRRLDYHPHVHLVMPAGAINHKEQLWRVKKGKYLFDHKALAKVFRAKLHEGVKQAGLPIPIGAPGQWIVDCKHVGRGDKALVYLGRYLYRGVIQEKDILSCKNKMVTFRYRNSKTGQREIRTVSGVEFLRLILQHTLPKGFRRARNYGFLHPNSKRTIALLQLKLKIKLTPHTPTPRPVLRCSCCGGPQIIVARRIKAPRVTMKAGVDSVYDAPVLQEFGM
jgi:Transposase zinc-binding domain/Putative transposase